MTRLNGGSVVWIDTMIILFHVLAPVWNPSVWASLIVIQLSSGLLKASTTPDTEVQRSVYTCAWGIPWLRFLGILGQVHLCRTRTLAVEKSIAKSQYGIFVSWDIESDDTPAQRAHLGEKKSSSSIEVSRLEWQNHLKNVTNMGYLWIDLGVSLHLMRLMIYIKNIKKNYENNKKWVITA